MKKKFYLIITVTIILFAVMSFLAITNNNQSTKALDIQNNTESTYEETQYPRIAPHTIMEGQIPGRWNRAHIGNIEFELYLNDDKTFTAYMGPDRIFFSGSWSFSDEGTELEISSKNENLYHFNFLLTSIEETLFLEALNGELVLVKVPEN